MIRVSRVLAVSLLLLGSLLAVVPLRAGPPVAPTEALTPAEQRALFKLPPGFEIQLVAAEPDIQKPMNLAFDARGRLWVTHSVEYPFAAADPAQARDGLTVLSDLGPDGRARRVEKFATGLNIPIGVLPLGEGREAIAWSIPNIWRLSDDDGDGRADRRSILYGPFDIADTHGNQNAFRLQPDGWVYACHGFRNDSKVKLRGTGDVVLQLQSGNTYRFRPDGSAIEQVTWGQVNPFGMCFDRWGQAFSADCHSKPITLLLRGGYYESFGKPHDGLGYAPPMTTHDHDSTGIAGVAYYDAGNYPAEYRHCFYVGNVITNVVHRDVPQWRGSSPWIAAPVDFVSCADPWFHPVDIQLGPDGALYIADFYNCIIGHYEVDLKHPRRDRERGRIWRVVWTGGGASPTPLPDLAAATPAQLVERLGDENLAVRHRATLELQRRGEAASGSVAERWPSDSLAAPHAVWLHATPEARAQRVAAERTQPSPPLVRAQLLRAVSESADWDDSVRTWVHEQLRDESPFVRRFAAEALARHPHPTHVAPLIDAYAAAPADDTQLVHALKIALRNQFREPESLATLNLQSGTLPPERMDFVVELVLATPSSAAAQWVFERLRTHAPSSPQLPRAVLQLARYGHPAALDDVVALAEGPLADAPARQAQLLRALLDGRRQRGEPLAASERVGTWARRLAARLLDPTQQPVDAWSQVPLEGVPGAKPSGSPWGIRTRKCADGQEIPVFDSIVGGESLTGILRSAPFTLPSRLAFWLCGHNGLPGTQPPPVNLVRLRLTTSGEIVAQEVPPRNDVAQRIVWDLQRWVGQSGVLEVVDADSGTAYAWIGIGRFEPAVVASPAEGLPAGAAGFDLGIQVVEQLRLTELLPAVVRVLGDTTVPGNTRAAAAQATFALDTQGNLPRLAALLADASQPTSLRVKAAELLAAVDTDATRQQVAAALATSPANLQPALALTLASRRSGAETLLATIAAGKASPRLLQEKVLVDRLRASGLEKMDERVRELTAGLPAVEERLKQVQAARLQGWSARRGDVAAGQLLFRKHCAACHKVAGEGAMIGPQLDGIGNRGAERLLEDLLDPNRNVDAAFRTTIVTRQDGQVVSGLKLRQEGDTLVLANNEGKELRVATRDIEESRLSGLSLMPGNFADTLPERDVADLLEYLLKLTGR